MSTRNRASVNVFGCRFQFGTPFGSSGGGSTKRFPVPFVTSEGGEVKAKTLRAHEWAQGLHLLPLVVQDDGEIIPNSDDRRVRELSLECFDGQLCRSPGCSACMCTRVCTGFPATGAVDGLLGPLPEKSSA